MNGGSSKLYVGNLSYATTLEELEALFHPFGTVKDVYFPPNRETRDYPCAGFAFVTFIEEADARRALDDLNGKTFGGRTLKVDFATPNKPFRSGGSDRRALAGGD